MSAETLARLAILCDPDGPVSRPFSVAVDDGERVWIHADTLDRRHHGRARVNHRARNAGGTLMLTWNGSPAPNLYANRVRRERRIGLWFLAAAFIIGAVWGLWECLS